MYSCNNNQDKSGYKLFINKLSQDEYNIYSSIV